MARLIEIKGLGTDIASIKKGIGDLRTVAGELNVQHAGLKAEIVDLTDQIKQHRADLKFEAETLGNSSGNGVEEAVQPPQPPPVTFTLDPQKDVEQPPPAPPATILNGAPTMRGDVQLIRS